MFNAATHGQGAPRHLSTDHDPLFEAHRWQANLRLLEIDEIRTVPHVPLSHPFVERLIGTIRREFLDQVFFWNGRDLERKLADFQAYYNAARSHASLDGHTPFAVASGTPGSPCGPQQHTVGISTAGTWFSCQRRPDKEFETHRRRWDPEASPRPHRLWSRGDEVANVVELAPGFGRKWRSIPQKI